MGKITVREMVKAYLKMNGYDGLVGDEFGCEINECGCEIKDLMPCESEVMDCEPGYKHSCRKCPEKKVCEVEGGHNDGGTWCISVSKEPPKNWTPS